MAAKISFYFDEHMPRAVEQGVTQRGHVVIMAVDSDMMGKDDDAEHLSFAAARQAVLVTCDRPFAGRAAKRSDHAGVICWTGAQDDFGGIVRALAAFAEQHTPEEVTGHVFWLK
jgi:hypothetical protein